MRNQWLLPRAAVLLSCIALLASCSMVSAGQSLTEPDDLFADIELETWEGELVPVDEPSSSTATGVAAEATGKPIWGSWQDGSSDGRGEAALVPIQVEASPEWLAFSTDKASRANHRFEVFLEYDIDGIAVGSRARPLGEGIVTTVGAVTEIDVGVLSRGPIKRRLPMATIAVDGVVYVRSSLFGPIAIGDPRLSKLASLDGGWGYAALEPVLGQRSVAAAAGAGPASRDQLVDAVYTIDEIGETTTGEVRGVATTTVHASIPDTETLGHLLGGAFASPEAMAAGMHGDIMVDIDDQSRLRRVELTIWIDDASVFDADFEPDTALRMWMRVDLFDFGVDYEISAPLEATDITAEMKLLQELDNT